MILFSLLLCFVYIVTMTLFAIVDSTLSSTTTDKFGIIARILCDSIIPIICFVSCIKNSPKVE